MMTKVEIVEIADLVRIIRAGYPEAAEAYRQDCGVLATIRDTPGMAEHEADAMHNANCRSKTCAEYTQRLGVLASLVTKHLPDLWPDLHLVGSGGWWHEDPAFNWAVAEKELRKIEAVAVGKRVDEKTADVEPLVTLTQMAAMVNRSKRTLEGLTKDMPPSTVEGGGGKPAEWDWANVRPWLEEQFVRKLPEVFPGDRFRRS